MFEKWRICNVLLERITYESQETLESMCYGGMCYLSVDDMWDLFESLASYQWHYEYASESFICPFPPPYDFHAQSLCIDQVRDLYDHHSSFPHVVCSYCQSFDHDVNYCPYYDVFDESNDGLNAMIQTMN